MLHWGSGVRAVRARQSQHSFSSEEFETTGHYGQESPDAERQSFHLALQIRLLSQLHVRNRQLDRIYYNDIVSSRYVYVAEIWLASAWPLTLNANEPIVWRIVCFNFQLVCSRSPVHIKWPYGHWASTGHTRMNSRIIRKTVKLLFHSFSKLKRLFTEYWWLYYVDFILLFLFLKILRLINRYV